MRLAALFLSSLTLAVTASGQTNTLPLRSLSLDEAIQLAVGHNLGLKIDRLEPRIALFDLNAARGEYEPALNLSASKNFNQDVDRLLAGGFRIPGSESERDNFNAGLGGDGGGSSLTPWGMTYNLGLNLSDVYGKSFNRVSTNILSVPFENSVGEISVDLRQPLLRGFLIDGTRYNIRVAKNRLKWSEHGLEYALMNAINQTEQAYMSLIAAREFVKTQEKAVELATRLLMENRKRVEVGALAPLDEKQAESQAASREADLIQARNDMAIAEDRLKSLITDDYAEWSRMQIVPSESLTVERVLLDKQDSWMKALTSRPDLAQAKLDAERAGLAVRYAKNLLLPQLDLFGSYGYNGGGNEFSETITGISRTDTTFWSYGAALSLPLGNSSAKNRLRSNRALEDQTLLRLKALEQQIMLQVDDAIKVALSSYERIQATRAAREFAEAALDAEQKKLESGKSTSFQVLELQERLTTARSQEIQAITTYNRALAQLRFYEGATLDTRGINLETK